MTRDPVIGPAGDHEAPAPVADGGKRRDAVEAAVAVVDQVIGDREAAIVFDPHHAQGVATGGSEHQIGLPADRQRLQGRGSLDPELLLRREIGRGGVSSPVPPTDSAVRPVSEPPDAANR